MITFTEIVGCNGTVVYQAVGSQLSFVCSGRLQILLAYDGMVLLKLAEFEYGINGNEQIAFDDADPQFSLVLYLPKYPKDQWILKINENADAVASCLGEKCYLKSKRQAVRSEQGRQEGRKEEEKVEKVVGRGEREVVLTEEKEDRGLLVGASEQIGKGLKFTGGMLSKGFENLGGFIAKKVARKEETEVSEQARQNLRLAKNTTKNVLEFTSEQVGNLFRFGKKVAADVGERFEKSEKGQEMQENPYYETVKEGAKTGVGVLANLYDGVVGAVYAVGSGVAKGATKIVGARYGEQAEQAADQAFEGAGNIAKVMRVPNDQAAKVLK